MDEIMASKQLTKLETVYDVFWDECQSINLEHDHSVNPLSEAEMKTKETEIDQENDDIDWLNDIGFSCVIMKYENEKEIDPDDIDILSMTATLTRRQSETVRKRIKSLNDTMSRRKRESGAASRRPDVRDIFPAQPTKEDSSDREKHDNVREGIDNLFNGSNSQRDTKEYLTNNIDTRIQNVKKIESSETKNDLSNVSYMKSSREMEGKPLHSLQAKDLFYTPDAKTLKDTANSEMNMRPPGPRRAVSEGIVKVYRRDGMKHDTQERPKLDKTKSEGSPLRSYAATPRSRHAHPKPRSNNYASSEEIGRIYGVSPKNLEEMRHKSAEDLLKLTIEDNNNLVQHSSPLKTSCQSKNEATPIEEDAKLNIGTDLVGKEKNPSPLFGEAFPALPNFTLQPEKLGITGIPDLSESDMVKVRSLALIELTALFDTCGIPMKRRKQFTKLKQKEHGVFGVPLTILSQRDKKSKQDGSQAPKFFKDLIAFLKIHGLREEGLLRIPGSQQRIKALKDEIEEAYSNGGFFSWQNRRISDVATLLKQFLRELPSPLLTPNYQETFIAVSELKDRKLQLQALNLLILLLPTVNRDTLQELLEFLTRVIAAENVNRMGLNNVAMIMAPNLFMRGGNRANLDEINKAAATTDVMRMLIKYQNIIWTVPGFMVTQIRYVYEAGSKGRDSKAVKKIIAKRMKSEASPVGANQSKSKFYGSSDELDYGDGDFVPIVRVKAPMCNKTCMAIQLTEYITAADIVSRFRSKRKNSYKEYSESSHLKVNSPTSRCRSDSNLDKEENYTFSLYECGGNIGERRLDPNTNIAALLKVNPCAELILRSKEVS
ncbi:rho GTPase-activating protein 18-like [Rhopilema esculentum]|uniref:rho GTPase-activating protein 18-like n=1 Tax=Rhopilema esculentum TaxID=499914 RepID=UPI0031DEE030